MHINEGYEGTVVEGMESNAAKNDSNKLNELKEAKRLKRSILKNVFAISFAFSLIFTSYNSLSNLQSSIHRRMGTISLGVIYVAMVISCFFIPSFVIKKLNPKWSVCLAMFLYSPYFASLFFPRYYTFVPSAFLMGASGAFLWAAKCTYMTKIAEKYEQLVGEKYDVIIVRFFCIFFFFMQCAQIWGNLISSVVLSVGVNNFTRTPDFLESCGKHFCPSYTLNTGDLSLDSSSTELQKTEFNSTTDDESLDFHFQTKIYVMTTIYLVLALSAAGFVALVVDPLKSYGIELKHQDGGTIGLILATFNHMKKPYQLLIVPLTIYSGMQLGLLSADYTASYVTCGIGVHMVGYAYLCFGVSDAIFSLVFIPLIKLLNRIYIVSIGALVNISMIGVMLAWKIEVSDFLLYYLIPSFWGISDAVWQTQVNSLYGVIFPGESAAAFSNYRLWESFGFIIAYVMSSYLCMEAKLYINLLFLIIGMAGYYTIEVLEARKVKNNS